LILAMLTAILSHSAWKTLTKAVKTLKKERTGEVQGTAANDSRLSKNIIERAFNKVRSVCGWHSRLQEPEPPSTPRSSSAEPAKSHALGGNKSPALFGVMTTTPVKDVGAASVDHITLFEASPSECGDDDLRSPLASPLRGSPLRASPHRASPPTTEQESPTAQEQPQFPRGPIAQFGLMWLIVILCIIVRGGRGSPGLVSYCGQTYWIITGVTMQALFLLSLLGMRRAVRSTSDASGADTFQWTSGAARKVALYSLGAGTLAALCGIGGGMVMGPILLDLGVLPQVQSATTATTLLVLSSSTAVTFLVQGSAPTDYAIFMAFATASGAVIGKAVMGFLIKLYRRPSAIIFVLGGIILASVIVMATTGTINVINDIQRGNDLGFKSVCGAGLDDI